MAKRSKIAQQAYDIAKPVAEQMGLELVDAEYKKEGQSMFLRLFVDKKGGLEIDDCETFSRTIDPILDEKLVHDADYFEVSSPGLTRPLTQMEDFLRYEDEVIEVSLFAEIEGVKNFLGKTVSATEENVTFAIEDSKQKITVGYDKLSRAVRHIEF